MVGERHGEQSRDAGGVDREPRPGTSGSPLARRFSRTAPGSESGGHTLARRRLLGVLVAVALGLIADTALAASADEGKTLFDAQCASCHTIGGGDGVGPDLEGVVAARGPDWVHAFILNPQQVVDSGDPAAKELVDKFGVVMPTLGLNAAQVDSIVAFLEAEGGGTPPRRRRPRRSPRRRSPPRRSPPGRRPRASATRRPASSCSRATTTSRTAARPASPATRSPASARSAAAQWDRI